MQDPKKTKQAHNSHGDSTHDQTSACALACAGSAVRRDNENSHDNFFAGVGRYSPVDGTAAPAALPSLPTASVDVVEEMAKRLDDLIEVIGAERDTRWAQDALAAYRKACQTKAGR